MPNITRKNKRKQNKPTPATKKGGAGELSTKLTIRTWLMGRTVVTLAGPTILASYAIYVYFWKGGSNSQVENTWGDAILLAMVIFSLILIIFVSSIELAAKFMRLQESVEQRNLRTATVLKTITIFG